MSGQANSSLQMVPWTKWTPAGTSPGAIGNVINLVWEVFQKDATSEDIKKVAISSKAQWRLAEFFCCPFPLASGDGCTLPNTSRNLQVRPTMQVIPLNIPSMSHQRTLILSNMRPQTQMLALRSVLRYASCVRLEFCTVAMACA